MGSGLLNAHLAVESALALHRWFLTPMGERFAQALGDELLPFQDCLRGDTLLQLGLCGKSPWLSKLDFQRHWVFSPAHVKQQDVRCLYHDIPLPSKEVSCVLAPLMLETFSAEHPLDEIDRVLASMGHVVFIGVNPWSLWGAWSYLGKHSFYESLPMHLYSAMKLKRAMLARGYQLVSLSDFYYIPPIRSARWLKRLDFLEATGKLSGIIPSGFYCLIMQKRQIPLTWSIAPKTARAFLSDIRTPLVGARFQDFFRNFSILKLYKRYTRRSVKSRDWGA